MSARRNRDRALLRRAQAVHGKFCKSGRCYYCDRTLIVAAALSPAKTKALNSGQLTCGPCVHVLGRLPWRQASGRGLNPYRLRRILLKRRVLRGEA